VGREHAGTLQFDEEFALPRHATAKLTALQAGCAPFYGFRLIFSLFDVQRAAVHSGFEDTYTGSDQRLDIALRIQADKGPA
jgi:hypothetical protein